MLLGTIIRLVSRNAIPSGVHHGCIRTVPHGFCPRCRLWLWPRSGLHSNVNWSQLQRIQPDDQGGAHGRELTVGSWRRQGRIRRGLQTGVSVGCFPIRLSGTDQWLGGGEDARGNHEADRRQRRGEREPAACPHPHGHLWPPAASASPAGRQAHTPASSSSVLARGVAP